METDTTTEAANGVFELNLCDMGLTIPVSHLALEDGIDVPFSGWQQVFDHLGIKTLTDPAGRSAITTLDARKLLSTLKRRDELAVEAAQRRTERMAKKYPVPVGPGLPVQEGMTPVESMVAAGGVVSLHDEFGDRPKPRFLEDEILAGEQEQAAKRRLAAERAKQRLLDQAKDKLQ